MNTKVILVMIKIETKHHTSLPKTRYPRPEDPKPSHSE
jgi:hypothetical protein